MLKVPTIITLLMSLNFYPNFGLEALDPADPRSLASLHTVALGQYIFHQVAQQLLETCQISAPPICPTPLPLLKLGSVLRSFNTFTLDQKQLS